MDRDKVLKNWTSLNEHIGNLSLDELKRLLKHEESHQQRGTFIKRLQQRINKKARPYET